MTSCQDTINRAGRRKRLPTDRRAALSSSMRADGKCGKINGDKGGLPSDDLAAPRAAKLAIAWLL